MSADPKRPRYWYCVIGPVPDDAVPDSGDFQPRMAVRDAVSEMTGLDPVCASGWLEESAAKAVEDAVNRDFMKRMTVFKA